MFKLLTGIISRRKSIIKEASNSFSDAQAGSRRGRACGNKVGILLNSLHRARAANESVVLISFDIVKAFDRVGREAIDDAFQCIGFNQEYRDFHKNLYSNITAQVSTYHGLSEKIQCKDRLAQGDVDSPSTFTEIMEMLLVWLEEEEIGYSFGYNDQGVEGKTKSQPGAFMDDLFVVVPIDKLQRLCNMVTTFFNTYDMEVNVTKTKAMCFGNQPIHNITLKQTTSRGNKLEFLSYVPKGSTIRVLGYMIADDLSWSQHCSIVMGECLDSLSKLNDSRINIAHKSTLINMDVFGKLTYSANLVTYPDLDIIQKTATTSLVNKQIAKNISPQLVSAFPNSVLLKDVTLLSKARLISESPIFCTKNYRKAKSTTAS